MGLRTTLMGADYITVGLAAFGMFASWMIWVTVMIFEIKTKISLIQQEIDVLRDVQQVLSEIRDEMRSP